MNGNPLYTSGSLETATIISDSGYSFFNDFSSSLFPIGDRQSSGGRCILTFCMAFTSFSTSFLSNEDGRKEGFNLASLHICLAVVLPTDEKSLVRKDTRLLALLVSSNLNNVPNSIP